MERACHNCGCLNHRCGDAQGLWTIDGKLWCWKCAAAEIERLRRERRLNLFDDVLFRHFARAAEWFQDNEGGTPVPEWCFLGWCDGEPMLDEETLIESEKAAEAAEGNGQ